MPRKLAERQTSLHQCQVSELESTLWSHTDKVRKNVMSNNVSNEILKLLNSYINQPYLSNSLDMYNSVKPQ